MLDRFEVLKAHYKEKIESWDWESLKKDAFSNCAADFDGNIVASTHLGTITGLAPSGKFYSLWCTNQTRSDIVKDECFFEALDEVAEFYGMFVSSGDGDPNDLFLQAAVESLEQVSAFVTEEDEELAKELLGEMQSQRMNVVKDDYWVSNLVGYYKEWSELTAEERRQARVSFGDLSDRNSNKYRYFISNSLICRKLNVRRIINI